VNIDNIIDIDKFDHFHFIGIGGIGMSALALTLLSRGKSVSGSDKNYSNIISKLESLGAKVSIGEHKKENIPQDTKIVIKSTAIYENNPELVFAKENDIKIYHRADLLNNFLRTYNSIAVTGTHGKTSTSTLMSLILKEADFDPTAIIGGKVHQFGDSNALIGKSNYLVAEVDESDQSIQKLSANYAIITNLEEDHLDHYKDLDEIISIMKKFISNMPKDATLIVCEDSYGNKKAIEDCDKNIITYSLFDNNTATYIAKDIKLSKNGSRFKVYRKNEFVDEFFIATAGLHYVSNALSTIACSELLGVDLKSVKKALEEYKGVSRRFEIIDELDGRLIVDDYAHHPTEIKATLSVASLYKRPVTSIFQPHRYSRTKALLEDFSKSFDLADRIIITDVYGAGEKQEEFDISSLDLYNLTKKNMSSEKEVHYLKFDEISEFLNKNKIENELIITLGAGSITNVSRNLRDVFFPKVSQ